MADTTHKSRKRSPNIRRKNLNIDQTKLDRVVQLLEARSETEAVDQALDLVLFRQELVEGVRRIAGSGGVENFFGDGAET
ncbi:MAG: hypothetical protein ACR2H9_13105 [Longimicrobiaceae bacterium]|jgi:hypothetical protein